MRFDVTCGRFDTLGHTTFKPVIVLTFMMPVILGSCRFWPGLISFFKSIFFISFHWINSLKSANQNRNHLLLELELESESWILVNPGIRIGVSPRGIGDMESESQRLVWESCDSHAFVEWGISFRWFHTIVVIPKKSGKTSCFVWMVTTIYACASWHNHFFAGTQHISPICPLL